MSKFLENALATFDKFGKTFDELDKAFDFDKTIDGLMKEKDALFDRGKGWLGDFSNFVKEVHDNLSDLEVEVPYNIENDTLKYSIDNGVLTVEVKSHDGTRSNVVTTTIPNNAEIDKMTKNYDDNKKVITFVIPKKKDIKSMKNDKIQNLIKAYNDKEAELKKQFWTAIDKVETETDTTEHKVKTSQPRDKKGRFAAKIKNGKVEMTNN